MSLSPAVYRYLNRVGVPYDLSLHSRTARAIETARVAAVPPDCFAKAVLVRRGGGYVLAAVPASCQVRLEEISELVGEPVCLACEDELEDLFTDCACGAVPAIGDAYGVQTIVDSRLEGLADVYFEAGDHYSVVHMNGPDFDQLTANAMHAPISSRH